MTNENLDGLTQAFNKAGEQPEKESESNVTPPKTGEGESGTQPTASEGKSSTETTSPTVSDGQPGSEAVSSEKLNDFKDKNPGIYAAIKKNADAELNRKLEAAKTELNSRFDLTVQEKVDESLKKISTKNLSEIDQKTNYINELKNENKILKSSLEDKDKTINSLLIEDTIKMHFLDGIRSDKMKRIVVNDLKSKFTVNEAGEVVPLNGSTISTMVKDYKEKEFPEFYNKNVPNNGLGFHPQNTTKSVSFEEAAKKFKSGNLNFSSS